jgi:hypothetical protein
MTHPRNRAERRAQASRANGRARNLVRNVWRHRADDPSDHWMVSPEKVERLERMYSRDRTPHSPRVVRGEHRQERRAAADEREQLAEANENPPPCGTCPVAFLCENAVEAA